MQPWRLLPQLFVACIGVVIAQVIPASLSCSRALDVLFVVDGSGSVSPDNFQRMLNFIADVALVLPMGASAAQFGVIQYASSSRVEIPLGQIPSNATIFRQRVKAIQYMSGGTQTGSAINVGTSQFSSRGRPVTAGVAYLMMVMTDGQSSSVTATTAAANAARQAGITVACITIGNGYSLPEVTGIVGGNMGLWYRIEFWSGVDSAASIGNLTRIACQTPAAMSNILPIETNLVCDQTLYVVYKRNINFPVALHSNGSNGIAILCHSFSSTMPQLSASNYAVVASGTMSLPWYTYDASTKTTCVVGCFNCTASSTAFPGSSPGFLYVSLTTISDTTRPGPFCGGEVSLVPAMCAIQLATNITQISGGSAQVAALTTPINATWVGDPANPLCPQCPANTGFLAVSGGSAANICASQCIGKSQFMDSSGSVPQCGDCHPSCATCVAPGSGRSCVTCAASFPSKVYNGDDPSFTSPFWRNQDALKRPVSASNLAISNPFASTWLDYIPAVGLNATGTCNRQCPVGFTLSDENVCGGQPDDFIRTNPAATRTLLVAVCLPPSVSVVSCARLANSSTAATYAGLVAAAAQTTPAAIFLRSCATWSGNHSFTSVYAYNISVPALTVFEDVNQTSRFAAYNSSCSAILTFAYTSVAAAPAISSVPTRILSLQSLTTDGGAARSRASSAAALLSSYGVPGIPPSNASSSAFQVIQLCLDSTGPNNVPSSLGVDVDPVTLCEFYPAGDNDGSLMSAGAIAGLFFGLLFLLALIGLGCWYCQWRSKRVRYVKAMLARKSARFMHSINGNVISRPISRAFSGANVYKEVFQTRAPPPYTQATTLPGEAMPAPQEQQPQPTVVKNPLAEVVVMETQTPAIMQETSPEAASQDIAMVSNTTVVPNAMREAALEWHNPRLSVRESFSEFLFPGRVTLRDATPPPPSDPAPPAPPPGYTSMSSPVGEDRRQRMDRVSAMGGKSGKFQLAVGVGDILREAVRTETVVLRPVNTAKMDPSLRDLRKSHAFTAVVGRDVIAEPSKRRIEISPLPTAS